MSLSLLSARLCSLQVVNIECDVGSVSRGCQEALMAVPQAARNHVQSASCDDHQNDPCCGRSTYNDVHCRDPT